MLSAGRWIEGWLIYGSLVFGAFLLVAGFGSLLYAVLGPEDKHLESMVFAIVFFGSGSAHVLVGSGLLAARRA